MNSARFHLSSRQAAILQDLDRLNKEEQMMVLRDAIGHKLSAAEQISLLRDTLKSVPTIRTSLYPLVSLFSIRRRPRPASH
jgi:hypothetical protein